MIWWWIYHGISIDGVVNPIIPSPDIERRPPQKKNVAKVGDEETTSFRNHWMGYLILGE